MELLHELDCFKCKHFDTENEVAGLWCKAFPDDEGIPDDIASGSFIHDKPHEGDNGIQFEPIK
jgi:hypothetical protein